MNQAKPTCRQRVILVGPRWQLILIAWCVCVCVCAQNMAGRHRINIPLEDDAELEDVCHHLALMVG
jgi:hypothetical protein